MESGKLQMEMLIAWFYQYIYACTEIYSIPSIHLIIGLIKYSNIIYIYIIYNVLYNLDIHSTLCYINV